MTNIDKKHGLFFVRTQLKRHFEKNNVKQNYEESGVQVFDPALKKNGAFFLVEQNI